MEAVEVSAVMEDLLPVPATGLPPDRFLDRAVLARVQQPCPRFGEGRQTGAAAGTGRSSLRSSPLTWTSSTWSGLPG